MAVEFKVVPIENCIATPDFNTRTKGLGDLTELIESIKSLGIKEPLLGKAKDEDSVEIYAGFRRLAAAKEAGLTEVPVMVHKKKDLTVKQMLLCNVTENVQREDLNPVDEALAYARLQQDHQMSTDEIAASLGIKSIRIQQRFRLLKLSDVVKEAVHEGRISISAALEIDRLPKEKHGKFVDIAMELSGIKLISMINKELDKAQKKLEAGGKEIAPEKEEPDPNSITELVRASKKSISTICIGLGWDGEEVDKIKDVDLRIHTPEHLVILTKFFENISEFVTEDVEINEKAQEEIQSVVDGMKHQLNLEHPIVRDSLMRAIGTYAISLAKEKVADSGKRPKVTYAIGKKAIEAFYRVE